MQFNHEKGQPILFVLKRNCPEKQNQNTEKQKPEIQNQNKNNEKEKPEYYWKSESEYGKAETRILLKRKSKIPKRRNKNTTENKNQTTEKKEPIIANPNQNTVKPVWLTNCRLQLQSLVRISVKEFRNILRPKSLHSNNLHLHAPPSESLGIRIIIIM